METKEVSETFEKWVEARMDFCLLESQNPGPNRDIWVARASVYHECLSEWRKTKPCWRTNVIEKLQEHEYSWIDAVSFHWQGMNIWLGKTVDQEGNKSLTMRVGGVGAAVRIMDSTMESWTISVLAESSQGVGVLSQDGASICVGPAQSATEKDM